MASTGAMLQFLQKRAAFAEPTCFADSGQHTLACIGHSISDAGTREFRAAFTTRGWLDMFKSIPVSEPGLTIMSDCTYKVTERRIVCIPLELLQQLGAEDAAEAAVVAAAVAEGMGEEDAAVPAGKGKGCGKGKDGNNATNALVLCVVGFLACH